MLPSTRRRLVALAVSALVTATLATSTTGAAASAALSRPDRATAKVLPTQTFSIPGTNTGAIPDGGTVCNPATAGTRDILFNVSGIGGALTDLAVTVDLAHGNSGDLRIVLVAPTGAGTPVLVTPGAASSSSCGYTSNLEGTYTFDDQALSTVWPGLQAHQSPDGALPSGAYRASGLGGSPVSLTAPFASLANPNGTWTLRVQDTSFFTSGSISAATLTIKAPASGPCDQAKAKVAAAQAAATAAQAALTAASKTLDVKKTKLAKAQKKGHAAKIKKARKAVKKAKAAVRTAEAAAIAAQATLSAAQTAQAAVC
jgi:subtilisin-like proprotein convertase family protein